ncbi:hypothetical protein [Nonomuraea dietziae]|nr:hypothetical protein [Nonomuraea dietziae]
MARHHGVDLEDEVEREWLVWKPGRRGGSVEVEAGGVPAAGEVLDL